MSAFGGGGGPSQKCALCGVTGAVWEVWGVLMCPKHHAEWLGDERFSAGAINAALGLSSNPEQFTTAGHARYCAEATKRTRAWVGEMRRRAA